MSKKRALISVSDKTGIVEFAQKLVELDFRLFQQAEQVKFTRCRDSCDWN